MAYPRNMELSTLSIEDRRSWHLNATAIEHACSDWATAYPVIIRNLDRMEREKRVARAYVSRCRHLMQQGPEAVREAFLALSEEGQVLRSIHPWAGLLPNAERLEILRKTRTHLP